MGMSFSLYKKCVLVYSKHQIYQSSQYTIYKLVTTFISDYFNQQNQKIFKQTVQDTEQTDQKLLKSETTTMAHLLRVNSSLSHTFTVPTLLIILQAITLNIFCLDPNLEVQSSTEAIYSNTGAPTSLFQTYNMNFATSFTTVPMCIYNFNRQLSDYNVPPATIGYFYINIKKLTSSSNQTTLSTVISYGGSGPNPLAKIVTVKYICFINYYNNICNPRQSFPIGQSNSISGLRTYTQYRSFISNNFTNCAPILQPSPYHYETTLERIKIVYWVPGINFQNALTNFDYAVSATLQNLTTIRFDLTFTTTASTLYLEIECFLINLDKFPSDPIITFQQIQITGSTSFSGGMFDESQYLFGFLAQKLTTNANSIGTNVISNFTVNYNFLLSGFDSATIGFFVLADNPQQKIKRFTDKHCASIVWDFASRRCSGCNAGYQLNSNLACISTISNCQTTNSANPLLCDVCSLGHDLSTDQSTCLIKVSNCSIMHTPTECRTCENGLPKTSNNTVCGEVQQETESLTTTEVAVGTSVLIFVISGAAFCVYSTFFGTVIASGVFDQEFINRRRQFRRKEEEEMRKLAQEQNKTIEEVEMEKRELIKERLKYMSNALSSA